MKTGTTPTLPGLARYALLVVLIIFAISSLIYLIWSALCPFTTDQGEGSIMLYGRMLSQGQQIYRDPSTRPYAVNAYNPLYIAFLAALVCIFGAGFIPAKIFSLIVTLLVVLLIFLIIRISTGKTYWALFFSLLFLVEPGTLYWGATVRVDMTAAAFALAAIYVYLSRARHGMVVACFCLLCAFFTKQSSIAALLAITLHCFKEGERRKAITFFLSFMVIALTSMAVLNFITKGNYFFCAWLFHVLTGTDQVSAKLLIGSFLKNYLPLLISSFVSIIYFLRSKDVPNRSQAFLLVTYAVVLIMQSTAILKNGASHNLFLELNAACCVMTGLLFAHILSWQSPENPDETEKEAGTPPWSLLRILSFLLIMIQIFVLWGPAYLYRIPGTALHSLANRSFPGRFQRVIEENSQVMEEIKSYPDPVWSENVSLLLLADREIIVGELFGHAHLPARFWDLESLLSDFREKRFSLVILGDRNLPGIENRLPPAAFAELQKNYRLNKRIGPYYLFVPSETVQESRGKEEPH
jgi:hypothetical protein